jgi:hypothetical protein
MTENLFGKQRGRFDEVMTARVQRDMIDQFIATFRAIPPQLKTETLQRFNAAMAPDKALIGYELREIGEKP